jgi:hypothetical protein
MAAVLLRLREDPQFDRFLTAIGLRNGTGPDVVARFNTANVPSAVIACVLRELKCDRAAVGRLAVDRIAVNPLDRAAYAPGLSLLLRDSGRNRKCTKVDSAASRIGDAARMPNEPAARVRFLPRPCEKGRYAPCHSPRALLQPT